MPATTSPAPMPNARLKPPVSAEAVESPPASRAPVRVVDRVARTARPSAPPTCCVVLTRPEASPESLAVAPDIASVISAGNDSPAPVPSRSITGRTSVA